MRSRWLFAAMAVLAVAGNAVAAQWTPPRGTIAELQRLLRERGYDPGPVDGVLTQKTRRAIVALECAAGLAPDGIAGPEVMRLLTSAAPPAGVADPVVRTQEALGRLGFLTGPADGVLGPATRDAIIRFQVARKLPIDPRVSDRLLIELREAYAPAAAPSPPAAPPAAPESLGRQKLPPGVAPPSIR